MANHGQRQMAGENKSGATIRKTNAPARTMNVQLWEQGSTLIVQILKSVTCQILKRDVSVQTITGDNKSTAKPGARFSKVPKSFRTRKAIANSQSF